MGAKKNEINHERKCGNSIVNKSMVAMESQFESKKRKLRESYQNIENNIYFPFFFLKRNIKTYN